MNIDQLTNKRNPVVLTQGVSYGMTDPQFAQGVKQSLHRFMENDWGESKDKKLNNADPKSAMGVYTIPQGDANVVVWIKSDNYGGHEGIDTLRTVLYPSEY